jgi:hypothetical protein
VGQGKTKNTLYINGLESFDEAVDCASSNNRLKRAAIQPRANSGLRRNWLSRSGSGPIP